MSEETKVELRRLIVHILDTNLHLPVLSEREHPVDDEITGFIEKHVTRIIEDDDLRTAVFTGENNRLRELCYEASGGFDNFVPLTQEIAGILFDIMQKNVDIPPADLICCLIELDHVMHLGILKLNYKPSYIHYVQADSDGKVNSIVKQKTALPGENQKIDECALISLNDFGIRLLEKKYDVNGEKIYYFSALFLNCAGELSGKEKVKAFKKATENFNKKYFDEDFRVSAEIKNAVAESIDHHEAINVAEVAENVFRQNPEMRQAYIEHIEKSGLRDRTITVNEELAEKSFKRQKIKTDTGIEISLPVEYYRDNQKVEFINNIDGTISIIIKNISRITDA